MPVKSNIMCSSSFKHVSNKPEVRPEIEDATTMLDWVRQSAVSGVRSLKEIKAIACDPSIDVHLWQATPAKRTTRFGLINAINLYGVVRSCSAKAITLAVWINISKRAGVDEHAAATNTDLYAQCVRVTVTSSSSPLRTSVNNKLLRDWSGTCHSIHTARFKRKRDCAIPANREFVKLLHAFHTAKPKRLFTNAIREQFKIGAVEHHRTRRERIQQMFGAITCRLKHPPTVVIAEAGKGPSRA